MSPSVVCCIVDNSKQYYWKHCWLHLMSLVAEFNYWLTFTKIKWLVTVLAECDWKQFNLLSNVYYFETQRHSCHDTVYLDWSSVTWKRLRFMHFGILVPRASPYSIKKSEHQSISFASHFRVLFVFVWDLGTREFPVISADFCKSPCLYFKWMGGTGIPFMRAKIKEESDLTWRAT